MNSIKHYTRQLQHLLLLFLIAGMGGALTSCSGESDYTYSSLPARFTMDNVYQAPVLFTACNSMGEFCTVTISKDGKQFLFKSPSSSSSVNMTALNGYNGFYLGVSGLIIGLPTIPEMGKDISQVICFDLVCPNCYRDFTIAKALTLQSGGIVTCGGCHRSYDLNNVGIVSKGESGRPLFRYRVSYLAPAIIVSNR